jgi:hypothetical protein
MSHITGWRKSYFRARENFLKSVLSEICCAFSMDTMMRWHQDLIAKKYDGSARKGLVCQLLPMYQLTQVWGDPANESRGLRDAIQGSFAANWHTIRAKQPYTLNLKLIMSPSLTTYVFPSSRILPAALTAFSSPKVFKSSNAIVSARIKPRLISL